MPAVTCLRSSGWSLQGRVDIGLPVDFDEGLKSCHELSLLLKRNFDLNSVTMEQGSEFSWNSQLGSLNREYC